MVLKGHAVLPTLSGILPEAKAFKQARKLLLTVSLVISTHLMSPSYSIAGLPSSGQCRHLITNISSSTLVSPHFNLPVNFPFTGWVCSGHRVFFLWPKGRFLSACIQMVPWEWQLCQCLCLCWTQWACCSVSEWLSMEGCVCLPNLQWKREGSLSKSHHLLHCNSSRSAAGSEVTHFESLTGRTPLSVMQRGLPKTWVDWERVCSFL